MPDLGSARADFPGGDARTLFRSIKKILSYPDQTKLFICHDYPPETRTVSWENFSQ
jgi:glyoxylase-like metal-dependent hydrolase (beta-lactamase superfamily II)